MLQRPPLMPQYDFLLSDKNRLWCQ